MPRFHNWLQHHRLTAFFVLAYAISWSSWPVLALGMMPRMEFLPIGPLVAAVIVIGLAEGRAGYRTWGLRIIRWRVGWAWYAVALLLPAVLVLVTGTLNMLLGAAAPGLSQLTWSGLLTVFAMRLINPMDGPLGEEPGFRGYAVPLLQTGRSPLQSAAVLGVLVASWHLPLIVFGGLSVIGLPMTFVITFLYVWLFNRTGGKRPAHHPFPQQPGHVHHGLVRLHGFRLSPRGTDLPPGGHRHGPRHHPVRPPGLAFRTAGSVRRLPAFRACRPHRTRVAGLTAAPAQPS